jgi:proline iminopeptidase
MPPRRSGQAQPAREGHLAIRGARLFVRELGDGPPLVVLHGGPDFNHRYLRPELDRLATGTRVVYYDQRGRGLSSDGVAPDDVDLAGEIDDLDALRRHLGLATFALLGHSWGGVLALEYALRHPDRVSHLVLLNTAPASHADYLALRQHRRTREPGIAAVMQAISQSPAYARGDLDAEAAYYRAHFGATVRDAEQLADLVGRLRADFSPADVLKARAIEQRLYGGTWLDAGYDRLATLAGLATRALVVHGDRDLIPLASAAHVADAIAGARLVVLRDCGHFAHVERPAEVCREISAFLARR